jgi:hypothetical protein
MATKNNGVLLDTADISYMVESGANRDIGRSVVLVHDTDSVEPTISMWFLEAEYFVADKSLINSAIDIDILVDPETKNVIDYEILLPKGLVDGDDEILSLSEVKEALLNNFDLLKLDEMEEPLEDAEDLEDVYVLRSDLPALPTELYEHESDFVSLAEALTIKKGK